MVVVLRCVCVLACLVSVLRAETFFVPGDAPTIQGAVNLADQGDRILVAPGVYPESVNFGGKALTVRSTGGWDVTRIAAPAGAPFGVRLGSLAGLALLEGFEITGGTSAQVDLSVTGQATVRRCVLSGGPQRGLVTAGVGKLIEDCRIANNPMGGAWAFGPPPLVMRRCLIENNGSAALPEGGGLFGAILAEDCIIRGNTAQRGGGAAFLRGMDGCVFEGNTAIDRGGAYFEIGIDEFTGLVIAGAQFIGNHAGDTGGLYLDPGSFSIVPSHSLSDCVIADNTDDMGGRGLFSAPVAPGPGSTSMSSCTVVGNDIEVTGALLLDHCVVRDASVTHVTFLNVCWSNVEGYAGPSCPGTTNIDADPLFVDASHGVYALLPTSPCIDAGEGDKDMGALPFAPFVDARRALFGQRGLPGLSGTGTLLPDTPVTLHLERARPGANAVLVLGDTALHAPFRGGVLVPNPLLVVGGLLVDARGELSLASVLPAGIPTGAPIWAQMWIHDAAGPAGFAASNGLAFVVP